MTANHASTGTGLSESAYIRERRIEEKRLRDVVAADSSDLRSRRELAAILLEDGRIEEAASILGNALRTDYRDVPTLIAFAHAQRIWGNYAEAEQACLLALEHQPDRPEALSALAQTLMSRDQVTDAIPLLERSMALQPHDAETRRLYGVAFQVLGRLDEARHEFRHVISNDPAVTRAYLSLSEIETFTSDHDVLKRMHHVLLEMPAENPRLIPLHYALGKAYDDIGDYDRAFSFFRSGARLQRSQIDYREDQALSLLDEVMAVFGPAIVERHPADMTPSAMSPVFIVGMPRSGSTLSEQILSCHPDVHCSGETNVFADKLAVIRRDAPELPLFPEFMRTIDVDALSRVALSYRSHMASVGGPARVFVNKQLFNFAFMGGIHMALPDAKFIIMRRSALDTCFSAFASYFDKHVPYSYDLGELGRFYRKYEEVIEHWLEVLPNNIVRVVDYEALTSDVEGQTRGLLQFLGLTWDPACLAFFRSSHPARTASVTQVRRPLYRSSIGRWRRYAAHLQPLMDALGESAR